MTEEVNVESPTEIAELAVQYLGEGCFDQYTRLVCDLEQVVGASKVRRYLTQAGAGFAFLKRADRAAAAGDTIEMNHWYRSACRYIDEDEIAALAEEHRFNFVPQRQDGSAKPFIRLSFADVR